MKSVQFDTVGEPAKVLEIREVAVPTPGPGEVRVKMHLANINPSDTLFVRGVYGVQPKLPQVVPGFEGMGVIEEVGEGSPFKVGMRVIALSTKGVWSEQVILKPHETIPVPDAMSDEIACQAFVNPITAYGMLEESGLQEGDWLLITAGGSAFGKYAIQMAKARGIRTIVTVRRADQVEALKALGAEAVINTTEDAEWHKTARRMTGDRKGVQCVFEAIGGKAGAQALDALAFRGKCLVYGLLSLQDSPINNGVLIFKELTIRGFWLSTWTTRLAPEKMQQMAQTVLGGLASQNLKGEVEHIYTLDEIHEAVKHADSPGRNGKILVKIAE